MFKILYKCDMQILHKKGLLFIQYNDNINKISD